MEEGRALKLSSPSAGEPVIYEWPLTKTDSYDAAGEIIESIRFVSEEHKELNVVMEKVVKIRKTDTRSYESMKQLCENFSKAADTIRQLWKHATRPDNPNQAHASPRLLKHVVQQCYNRSVIDPSKLNHYYNAFSPETYGETSFGMLEKVVDEIKPGKKDVFLDLGSGVGQVVLYMAGGTYCRKVIGIEKADLPATYAETMQAEFSRWMKWYGKNYRPYELLKGNFLDERFRDLILKEATIIFVNNYAFGPDLNNKLKSIFTELKDGTRIVSSIPFCNFNARMSDRLMGDLGAMLDTVEITAPTSSVSWTCKNVPYFIHTVNRTKLEQYFFSQRAGGALAEKRLSSKSSSKSSSRESSRSREIGGGRKASVSARKEVASPALSEPEASASSAAAKSGAGAVTAAESAALFGPTTRRQWNEWVNQTATAPAPIPSAASAKEKRPKTETKEPSPMKESPAAPVAGVLAQITGDETSESGSGDEPRKTKRGMKKKRKLSVSGRAGSVRAGPGRPRKSELERRRSEDSASPAKKAAALTKSRVDAALALIHEQTLANTTGPLSPLPGSLEVADLMRTQPAVQLSSIPLPATYPPTPLSPPSPSTLGPQRLPAKLQLDLLMSKIRTAFEQALENMGTPEFRQEVQEEISREKTNGRNEQARNEELLNQKRRLEKQVAELKTEGVSKLNARMHELDVVSHTPADLLEHAKNIVEDHTRLKTLHWSLENEVGQLERQQRVLLSLREQGNAIMQRHVTPVSATAEPTGLDAAKIGLLKEIGAELRRKKALNKDFGRIRAEVLNLQATLPPNVVMLVDSLYPQPPAQVSQPGNGLTPPNSVGSGGMMGGGAGTGVARGAKRGRTPRGAGGAAPRKRAAPPPTSTPHKEGEEQRGAEQSPEDIERKIKDIVAKALRVDSAAKSAEKERRLARSVEKKARAKPPPPPQPAVPSMPHFPPNSSTIPQTVPPAPVTYCLPPAMPISAAPTFSSPGLVPVFVASKEEGRARMGAGPPLRSQSGSSAETESAPNSDQETAAEGKAKGGTVRPASVPHPGTGLPAPGALHKRVLDVARAASATPTAFSGPIMPRSRSPTITHLP